MSAMQISRLHLKVLAVTLDLAGHDSSYVLQRCGLADPGALDDPAWVDVEVFDRMMVATLEESMDPCFALNAATSPATALFGPIFNMVMYGPSLRQAMADLQRFSALVTEQVAGPVEVELVEGGPSARIVVRPLGCSEAGLRFRAEFVMTGMAQMLRLASHHAQDIHGLYFTHARPDYAHRYTAAFGPRVSFGQAECALHFNPDLLDRPQPGHNQAGYLAALTQAESALAAADARTDIAERLRGLLLSRLPELPNAAEAASYLGLSERSLRRHLAALGVSYAGLLEECRRLVAERLLADRRRSIKQVAEETGFSSVNSFHRAFRRWTGTTPVLWRQGAGAVAGGPVRSP